MLLVDTKEKVFMKDDKLKAGIADLRPVSQWLQEEVSMRLLAWSIRSKRVHGSVNRQVAL